MPARSRLWPDPRVKPLYGAAEVNWSHPLATGLMQSVLFYPQRSTADLVSRALATWTTAVETGPAVFGQASPGTTNTAAYINLANIPAPTPTLSFFTRAHSRATETNRFLCSNHDRDNSTNGVGAYIHWGGGGNAKVYFGANGVTHLDSGVLWSGGETRSLGASLTASSQRMFVDGAVKATATVATVEWGNSFRWCVAGTADSGGGQGPSWDGSVDTMQIWTRMLSDSEQLWLTKEPYAMLRPVVRRRYFVPTEGASTVPRKMHHYRQMGAHA